MLKTKITKTSASSGITRLQPVVLVKSIVNILILPLTEIGPTAGFLFHSAAGFLCQYSKVPGCGINRQNVLDFS